MRKAKLVVTFNRAPSYEVRIGSDVLLDLGNDIQRACHMNDQSKGTHALLLVDSSLVQKRVDQVKAALSLAGYRVLVIKRSSDDVLATAGELWCAMAQARVDERTIMVAMGDTPLLQLAGFVTTTFSEKPLCVYVPTTLAAALTMAVSDEAELDIARANHGVRVNVRPSFSCVDLDVLKEEDATQWLQGFALLVQNAFLDSDDFFFWLSDNTSAVRNHSLEVLCEALVRALSARSQLSSKAEQGNSQAFDCLYYGKELSDAAGVTLAQGMRFSALLSQFKGLIAEDIVQAQDALLTSLGFVQQQAVPVQKALDKLLLTSGYGDDVSLVLPSDIGCCQRALVPVQEVRSCLEVLFGE